MTTPPKLIPKEAKENLVEFFKSRGEKDPVVLVDKLVTLSGTDISTLRKAAKKYLDLEKALLDLERFWYPSQAVTSMTPPMYEHERAFFKLLDAARVGAPISAELTDDYSSGSEDDVIYYPTIPMPSPQRTGGRVMVPTAVSTTSDSDDEVGWE